MFLNFSSDDFEKKLTGLSENLGSLNGHPMAECALQ